MGLLSPKDEAREKEGVGAHAPSELAFPSSDTGRDPASHNQSADTAPRGLQQAVFDTLIRLHQDETSHSDPLAALSVGVRAQKIALGERPGGGVTLTHFSSVPQLHLEASPLEMMLRGIKEFEGNFARYLAQYQVVSGITPSRTALGVLSVALRKMNRNDERTCGAIRSLCQEARELDLSTPLQQPWSVCVPLKVDGVAVTFTLSLETLPTTYRALVRVMGSAVPEADRENKCGYRITFQLTHPHETEALRKVKALERQAVAFSVLLAPVVAAAHIIEGLSLPSKIASMLVGEGPFHSGLESMTHLGLLGAAGLVGFGIYRGLQAFFHSR